MRFARLKVQNRRVLLLHVLVLGCVGQRSQSDLVHQLVHGSGQLLHRSEPRVGLGWREQLRHLRTVVLLEGLLLDLGDLLARMLPRVLGSDVFKADEGDEFALVNAGLATAEFAFSEALDSAPLLGPESALLLQEALLRLGDLLHGQGGVDLHLVKVFYHLHVLDV